MIEVFKKSLIFSFFCKLRDLYQLGFFARFFRAISRYYKTSRFKLMIDSFVNRKSPIHTSVFLRVSGAAGRLTRYLGAIYEKSLINRAINAIFAFLNKITANSLAGKICRAIGFRGFLLIAFSLYLPLDYFLRNFIKIDLISAFWDDAFLLFGAIYVIYRRAVRKAPSGSRISSLDGYILMFLGVGFMLMCITSPDMSIAISGYRAQVEYILWFFVIVRMLENDNDFKIFYGALLAMSTAIVFHGIYQFIVATPMPAAWVAQAEDSVRTRVFSITGSPNILGCFTVMFAPLMAGVAYYSKKMWVKISALGLTGIFCMCCLFTFSKGAWFGLAIAIVVFAILLDKRVLALLVFVGGSAITLIPSISSRITFLFTSDYRVSSMRAGRMIRWQLGVDLLESSNSWLGFGLGRFGGAVAMQNQVIEKTSTFYYFYMDNYYLKTLVEMGYIGLIFYILMLFGLGKAGLKAIGRARKTEIYPLAVGIFSGLCGVLVHCYFENIFEVPYMMAYFWALAAGLIYLGFHRPVQAPKAEQQ